MLFRSVADLEVARMAADAKAKPLIDFLKKRVASGSADAAYDLGVRYAQGNGVLQDVAEAKRLLKLSLEHAETQALKLKAQAELDRLQ